MLQWRRWRAATAPGRLASRRAASPRRPARAARGCRETGRSLRARAGTTRRVRAACGRAHSAERRPAQGRVVRLRRPGRARRAGAPYRPPLLLPRVARYSRATRSRVPFTTRPISVSRRVPKRHLRRNMFQFPSGSAARDALRVRTGSRVTKVLV